MAHSNLNGDTEPLKTKPKDDEVKKLKYKTENHDYEKVLKSLKIDKD